MIESERLVENAAERGAELLSLVSQLADRHSSLSNPRGRGLMVAVTVETPELRDAVLVDLADTEHVLMLGCGTSAIRFRPPLTVTAADLKRAVQALDRVLTRLAG